MIKPKVHNIEPIKAWMVVDSDGAPYELCLTEVKATTSIMMSNAQMRVVPVTISVRGG